MHYSCFHEHLWVRRMCPLLNGCSMQAAARVTQRKNRPGICKLSARCKLTRGICGPAPRRTAMHDGYEGALRLFRFIMLARALQHASVHGPKIDDIESVPLDG